MATQQPTPKPQALVTPPITTTTEAPKPLGQKPTLDTAKTAASDVKPIDASPYGQSTLPSHEWLNTRAIKYEPISVMYLTGDYSGKFADLGYNAQTHREDQSYSWQPVDSRNVRSSLEFHNISPRALDFSVEFGSDNHDIRQLVENLAHLGEISGKELAPPLLQISLGKAVTDPWVLTKFSPEYSNPLPGNAGYRKGIANLSFMLQGGAATKHSTGRPLSATPLSDIARTESEAQKARQGEIARVNSLLSNCVSSEGISQIQELVESNKLNDPAAVLALPNDAMVSLAISGSISSETLADPNVASKLSVAIAQRLAESEPGSNPSQFAELATALQTGIPSGVSGDILATQTDGSTTFSGMVNDYNLITEAILTQDLSTDSPIFDRSQNPTAGARLTNFGSCGLALAGVGGVSGVAKTPENSQDAVEQAAKLGNLNQFFGESPSHDQVLVRLGLPPETPKEFTSCLVGGRPFSKQREFEDECQRCSGGQVNGRSLWTSFN